MHYTEKLFREEQYTGTPWKYAFHGMRFGNDEYNQNDWQDQTGVTKHGSPHAHVLKNIS